MLQVNQIAVPAATHRCHHREQSHAVNLKTFLTRSRPIVLLSITGGSLMLVNA